MARNKHPEETVEKILMVSRRLFAEKGYEHTTIQDIDNALGMSKGAVYHHFQSKEEIYDRIYDEYYAALDPSPTSASLSGRTGREKLTSFLLHCLTDPEKVSLDRLRPDLERNPRLLVSMLRGMEDAVGMVLPLIEEGNADGSLCVARPREPAEAFLLLANLWLGLLPGTPEELMEKFRVLKDFCDGVGMPILDDEVLAALGRYVEQVSSGKPDPQP